MNKLPLSHAQLAIYYACLIRPDSPAHNAAMAIRIRRAVDADALRQAWSALIERHPLLRSTYHTADDGAPFRAMRGVSEVPGLQVRDAFELDEQQLAQYVASECQRPFDLQRESVRLLLFRHGPEDNVLVINPHSITMDLDSADLVPIELSRLYDAACSKTSAQLPPVEGSFDDYVKSEYATLASDRASELRQFWKKALQDPPPPLALPTDRPHPRVRVGRGASHSFRIEREVISALREVQPGTSLFRALLSAYYVFLFRYTGQSDLVVATPASMRTRPEHADVVGTFVNVLVLRKELSAQQTFRRLMADVRDLVKAASSHRELPLLLMQEIAPHHDPSRTPLFQTTLGLATQKRLTTMSGYTIRGAPCRAEIGGLSGEAFWAPHQSGEVDFSVLCAEIDGALYCEFKYDSDLFDESTVGRMARHFSTLLESCAAAPDTPIGHLALLDATERARVVDECNATSLAFPETSYVHERFESQARRTPDAVAVTFEGTSITYGDLDSRADAVAERLLAEGVGPESLVAVFMDRSIEMVVAVLGVLKAGAAYVPVAPDYPADRIAYMIDDTAATVVLTHAPARGRLPEVSAKVVFVDEIEKGASAKRRARVSGKSLAYVIYTSGSTGKPKGAMNTHEGLRNRLDWMQRTYRLGPGDVVLQKTSFSFDVSVWELLWPLIVGARMVLARPGAQGDSGYLKQLIRSEKVTTLHFVPSMLDAFLGDEGPERCSSIKRVICSGEALGHDLAVRFHNRIDAELHNLYGPTEAAIDVSAWQVMADAPGPTVPIGYPIANTTLYVLDDSMQPVPPGVRGELYIGGIQLARGYWKRPDMTAAKFVPNPFGGGRLYRTGDEAVVRADGAIDFLGRLDRQVKLRGFRIELGEIESALIACEGVRQSLAVVTGDADKRIVAYVVSEASARDDEQLRQRLRKRLPEYMVPSVFVHLDAFPLTPNGKLDRKALPAPDFTRAQSEYVAPRTDAERALCEIIAGVLGLERVGITDNFFALGGHSLLVTKVVSRVRRDFGVDLGLRAVFEHPTVDALAAMLVATPKQGKAEITRVSRSTPPPLSFAEARLWFIDQYEPGTCTYNLPVALRLRGELDRAALSKALDALVERHETLRTRFEADAGQPIRIIDSARPVPVEEISVERSRVEAWLSEEGTRPFDLASGPLFRVALARLSHDEHVLLLSMHHIVSDGWSIDVLLRELTALYAAAEKGSDSKLPDLPIQYADYAAWQRQRLSGEGLEESLGYWRERLGSLPALELPTDRPRPPLFSNAGAVFSFDLDVALARELRELGAQHGCSLFMVMLAGLQILLSRYSGQKDFAIGTPEAQRSQLETEGLIGFFVNMLVLRVGLDGNPNVIEVLGRAREALFSAQTHAHVPFERIVDALDLPRDPSRTPLFQVSIADESWGGLGPSFGGLTVEAMRPQLGTAQEDLGLVVASVPGGGVHCTLNYAKSLFDASTIERLARHFQAVLSGMVRAPLARASSISLLDESERRWLLEHSDAPGRSNDRECAHHVIEQWARETPDAAAVIDGERRVTYRELVARARLVAMRLRRAGVKLGAVVALSATRRLETMVGIVAAWMCGAAYAPMDPKLPTARRKQMITRCGARVGLGYGDLEGLIHEELRLDDETPLVASEGSVRSDPENAMVILHTSGTTGEPKGVILSHRGVVSYVRAISRACKMGRAERVMQFASLSFDASLEEMLLAWTSGGALVLRDDTMLEATKLLEACERHGVTVLDVTTAYLPLVVEAVEARGWPACLQRVVIGGERAERGTIERYRNTARAPRLWSTYGPTEASISVTACELQDELERWTSSRSPLGKVVEGCRVYVLDERLQLAPIGVPGEICIGGTPLAHGYVGDAERTAERFVPDPFVAGERIYRTGDVGVRRADGRLEFVGRVDDQVKIRGLRIEPSEIAATLSRHPSVGEAVVLVRKNERSEPTLIAYLRREGAAVEREELQKFASERLPAYMVPAAMVLVQEWPLTPNGKLDTKRLPLPDAVPANSNYVAPRTPVEEKLAAIWSDVLGVERVGIDDDFFALGGHSLLATRVVSRVRRDLGVELAVRAMFERPTLAALASVIGTEPKQTLGDIPRTSREGPLPLSFAEGRLWFIDQYEPGTATYNLPVGLRLHGRLDRAALSRALDALVARHESLRTRYPSESGQPLRVVDAAGPVRIAEADIDSSALEDWADAHATHPFDLSRGPLFRAALARVGEDDHKLMLVMHHIVSDGWSTDVMMRELEELYSAAKEGREAKLPELPIQYADYAVWQRAWLSGARLEKSVGYWKQRLAGVSSLELPTDRPRPPTLSTNGADVTFRIEPELVEKLRALGRRTSCSLFMVLLGAYEVLLSRYSGQTDFAVGTPEARRNRLETENLIGFFVNTLVVRAELQNDPTVTQVLEQVREQMLSAHAHADVPFEAIVEALNPVRDPSRTPLFQAMFSFAGDASESGKSFGDLVIGAAPSKFGPAKFDLTLTCGELEGGALGCALTYATALFDAGTIERMARHFRAVLEQVATNAAARVSNLQLIDASERRHILVELNATETERSFEPVVRAFEGWAEKTPNAPAVRDQREALTYLRLERRANALAHRLRALGVGADVAVAVCLPRSAEMVVAQLAVLKAGGCYVSLDTSSPPERLAVIAKEAKIACAITTKELASSVEWGAPVSTGPFDEERESRIESRVRPDNLAYIIFTSGSTGTPKGVQLRHDSLSNLVSWYRRAYEPSAADRFGQVAAPSFDVSIAEVWPSLSSGGCLCIPSEEVRRDPAALVRWVRDERVTLAFMPTPLGEACLLEDWAGSSVRVLMLAGDALHAVAGGHPFQIDNLYGPTEYTVYTTWFRLPAGGSKSAPPIGTPLDNTRVHVLDSAMSPVPIGVSGELYIGGAGLARGYTRPDLTAERFVPDPFGPPGARLYRTGDLVRRRADGVIDFIGRIDHQVKIRGYRIELGEIESTLRAHPRVREAVVVARGEPDKRLVAYVVASEACGDEELRSHLRATLPDYMVPAAFVRLEALPLTPNGKIDRRALPAPDFATGQAPYVAPRTAAEEALAAIWSEVLGVERVGVDDDFFALGGHSLRAVKLAASVREKLGVNLPVRALFEAPTVARLAAVIASGSSAASSGPVVALRHGQQPRVAFAHALSGEVFAYGPLAHRLGDSDVLGLRAREIDPLPGDLPALAALYAEALRDRDVKYLCGWSMGGLVAFETARLLQKHGRAPAAVVLLDTYLLTGRDGANAGDALGYARDVSFELGADASADLRAEIERASGVAEAERAEMLALALERELRIDRRELEERMRVHATLSRAAASYEPAALDVPIHLVAPQPERPLRTWKGKLTPASVTQVPGDHYAMLRAPHVDAVAAALRAIIRG